MRAMGLVWATVVAWVCATSWVYADSLSLPKGELTADVINWPNSGLQLRPFHDVILQSFVFESQGKADTIQLTDFSGQTVVYQTQVEAGTSPQTIQANWFLAGNTTYNLISANANDGRYAYYTEFPVSNSDLSVLGTWAPSTEGAPLVTEWWFTFNDLQTALPSSSASAPPAAVPLPTAAPAAFVLLGIFGAMRLGRRVAAGC